MKDEIKRITIDKGHFTQDEYPFTIKPNFSTLGSIIEISPQEPIISFAFDDSIRNLGFNETIIDQEYSLSPSAVDMLSFDDIFLETDIAKGMIFRGKTSGIIHNWTMTVDPGYKYVESSAEGNTW